ncbi:MAG: metallophosphoesterase, partial [Bacteroidia bacterium]|nr:metallophosphoesterase [Bacteroidia bacterium]
MDSVIHSVLNQTFRLLPQKAIFWEEKQTLILGDLHFGKATHFRKNGIALSQSIATNDFDKFTALLAALNPKQVYFLGDLFHSEYNSEVFDLYEIIKFNSSVKFVLIKGNHDI